jgi:hypothetical protein
MTWDCVSLTRTKSDQTQSFLPRTYLRCVASPNAKPDAARALAGDEDEEAEEADSVDGPAAVVLLPTTRLIGTVMLGWRLAKARCARAVRFLVCLVCVGLFIYV